MQGPRIDEFDIYILRILARNCRRSFRSIGLELDITTNTVKNRIKYLVDNKILQRYVLHINFAVLGYKNNSLVIVRHNTSPYKLIEKLRALGSVYLHVDCLGGTSVFGIVTKENLDELEVQLSNTIKPATLIDVFTGDLQLRPFTLSSTDFRIIKLLLDKPRMTNDEIAKSIFVSKKTVRRRLEFMTSNHVLDFGIVYNPSAMKGYIYFGLIIQTERYHYKKVLDQIYLNFEHYLLRHPQTVHRDVIVLNLYSRNIYDIQTILKKAESFNAVTKAEIFQTLKTEILDKWVYEEIDKILSLK
jgi:DNA-binding Lrp family transcriptional regulator